MTAKEYLSRTLNLNAEICELKDQIDRLQTTLEQVGAVDTGKIRVDGNGAGFDREKWMDRKNELKVDLKKAEENFELTKIGVLEAILPMRNKYHHKILLLRYVKCLSWGKIAKEMFCDKRSICKAHARALDSYNKLFGE